MYSDCFRHQRSDFHENGTIGIGLVENLTSHGGPVNQPRSEKLRDVALDGTGTGSDVASNLPEIK